MGLLDIIQGMKNGPRGQRQPSRSGSGGWTSRIMMALLGLLAYKAFKGGGDQAAPTDSGTPPGPRPAAASLAVGINRAPQWAASAREQHLIPRAISGITCDCVVRPAVRRRRSEKPPASEPCGSAF
jgi:hypothetical protein